MELFAIALMNLTAVILIVSLVYIITTSRNKEKMALLDKGLDPKEYMKDRYFLNAKKTGMVGLGIGIGFLSAVLVDEFVIPNIDNPGIYPAMVLIFGGLSLLLFHRIYKNQE